MTKEAQQMQQMQQSATELSTKQERAIDLLLLGCSDAEAAAELGVDRSTVWRWRTGDPVFISELNSRRLDLWESYSDRLRGLLPKALKVIENTLEQEPDAWRLALAIVKASGLLEAAGEPGGPTDASQIERDRQRKKQLDELDGLMVGSW